MMFEEREVLEEAADRWWLFLLTGIAWLVLALLVFQWNYTTVYAVSFLFGFMALFAGVNEFFAITVSTSGWKIVHGILGVLFVLAGIWALVHPHNAFATLAALIGFFLLFKGIFDITVAFMTKDQFELLVAPVDRRHRRDPARLLGRRLVQEQGDPAGRLRRDHRALPRDHRDLPRLQAQGLAQARRGRLTARPPAAPSSAADRAVARFSGPSTQGGGSRCRSTGPERARSGSPRGSSCSPAEKELTRQSDELARRRRELPWVPIEKDYRFETDEGPAGLADLFRGRSQLLMYHFMFGPDYTAGCPACSAIADGFNGSHVHLENHDVMIWPVSRAPIDAISGVQAADGVELPVGVVAERRLQLRLQRLGDGGAAARRSGRIQLRRRGTCGRPSTPTDGGAAEQACGVVPTPRRTYARAPGVSAFALEDGVVYHTYSAYARGLDGLWSMYQWLDRAPKGRNEDGLWFRRRDEY